MTMRRDLNVVGGITDTLTYDYALLKQIVDGIQEQMRLQALYNEYTQSIQKGLKVVNTILQVLSSVVQMATVLSTLSLSSERMELNTYRTEDFHFGGGGGDDFPGGGGGFPGGSGGGFPGDGKDIISGQFLLNMDATADGQVLRRFLPTTTTITTEPVLGAMTSLTASSLIMNAANALTQIGDATTSIMAGGIHISRLPQIAHSFGDIVNSVYTITDSATELFRRYRESHEDVIIDTENMVSNDMEVDENDEDYELDDIEDEETGETTAIATIPHQTHSHTTTTSIQAASSNEQSAPIFTDIDGNDYLLSRLAEMTYEEIVALASRVIGMRVETPLLTRMFHTFNVFLNNQVVFRRLRDQRTMTITPSIIQMRTRLRRATTSNWSIETNGRTYTARDIERLNHHDRNQLDVARNLTIAYWQGGNQQTGESWTEIRRIDDITRIAAVIDYEVPITNSFTGNHITIQTPNITARFSTNGVLLEHHDDNGFSRLEYDHHRFNLERDAQIPTDSVWSVPGSNPIATAADIEMMNEEERTTLMNTVNSHGNVMSFSQNANALTGEIWTDIIYDGQVVATIDRRIHHALTIDDQSITIGNPDLSQFSITQQGIRWIYHSITGDLPQGEITVRGLIGEIAANAARGFVNYAWTYARQQVIGVARYCVVHSPIGQFFRIPLRLITELRSAQLRSETEDEEELEYSLQPIIDWCTYDGQGTDFEITMEDADEYAVSMKSCMQVAKSFRDSLKGPLALMCSKIQDIENNMNNIPSTPSTSTLDELRDIEQRLTTLETKCANIHCESSTTTGPLTLDNLLRSYDERLKVLEAKCANIQTS